MKAAIYSRKSKFTGKGESVENQIQLCKEYAIKYLNFDESSFLIYEDEGFSGGNTKRPEFQRLLKDAKTNKFQILICYRLDRISRNVSDFSQLINDLNKYNVNFVSIREQFDTTTPMGRAMMYIASVFAQLERETIAERIRDNMIQLAKTGRWLGGITPTGYKSEPVITIDQSGKQHKMYRLSPVIEEIGIIKLIYDKYISLKSITGVEKYLVEYNFSTKNGADFHTGSIRPILSNPVYAVADKALYEYMLTKNYDVYSQIDEFNGVNGLIAYNKTRQQGKDCKDRYRDTSEWIVAVGLHEGIIPSGKWIKAQELLRSNKQKCYRKVKSTQSLLSGVLVCSNCGSFMRPKTVQRKNEIGQQVFYYICEMKEKSKKIRCDVHNISGNILDNLVFNELIKIAWKNPPFIDDIRVSKNLFSTGHMSLELEKETLQKRIGEIDLGIQNLVLAISKGQKGEVVEALTKNMEDLTGKKEKLKRKLLDLQERENEEGDGDYNFEQMADRLGDSKIKHGTL
ncbi:recombinase family protein [Pseudobacteroides cellulosolvens]|uniref:Resolvase domain-containing protein n=1 Tax=Pseudobacteroides cellulosolvens ATCC 35603 = DSM 2933 TaxID=398512 RepID=A0A0L6JGP7_9FIRM|nr:recombinase family protein [Pseudobacteroides cellulosolvens]KNY24884.1 Resolvase domain-containing protein [Pseudobacteroides cellulosolvens ATCC 35603 = DSM 2933]